MADPVITDHYRVLAVFQRFSGLPEDVVVNSFAFRNDNIAGGSEGMADDCASVLDNFYTVTHPGATTSLRQHMGDGLVSLQYKVYDLGQPPPRQPIIRDSEDWVEPTGACLPGEVSLCLSFVATVNAPRSRGRVYIGPLSDTAFDSTDGEVRPSPAVISAWAAAGAYLLDNGGAITQVIISQADSDAKVVTGGWVDNAFDTQRRRGIAADARTNYGSELPPA